MFSSIIATHERPQLLQRTLTSLSKQTQKDFTTIVVNDSDKFIAPHEALNALGTQYYYLLRNGQPGPATSRNLGLQLVNSDYVMFLDDDDTFDPTHIQAIADYINKKNNNDTSTIYYCDFKVIEEDRQNDPPIHLKETPIENRGVKREHIYIKNVIPNSCLVYPSKLLRDVTFDSSLILFEDWDFLLAALKCANLEYIPINSVNIHKSYVEGQENIRRGNVNNEHLTETTLEIFRRHASPDEQTRQMRISRFESIGITLPAQCY